MNTKHINFLAWITVLLLLANCNGKTENQNDQSAESADKENEMKSGDTVMKSVAILHGANDSGITGNATFTTVGDESVRIELTISDAKPGGHAVHLHETGDCSADDATSAGGHWNPTHTKHGKRGDGEFHKGDIANMTVGENGKGSLEMTVEGWTIGGSSDSDILSKAVIIHDGTDDFTSQPSGAAGKRVACGVIEKKQI